MRMHLPGLIVLVFFCMCRVGFSQQHTTADPKTGPDAIYRHAMAIIDSKPDSALYYFEDYRKKAPVTDSLVRKRSIGFYNYAGGSYLSRYIADSTLHKPGLKKALTLLEKVIDMDSTNLVANINLMALYYNRGVRALILGDFCKQRELIENTDWNKPDSEIPSLAKLLECIKPEEYEKYHISPYFRSALPYALRVHRAAPENRSALEAMQGIYLVLLDQKQSDIYKEKIEKLRKNKK